jgi:hypothetical protein
MASLFNGANQEIQFSMIDANEDDVEGEVRHETLILLQISLFIFYRLFKTRMKERKVR